jgi:tetratricopeptide (TPR) repeat protein
MDRIWDWLSDEDRLVRPLTLVLGMVLIGAGTLVSDNLFKELVTAGVKRRFVFYLFLQLAWAAFWLYKRESLPRTKKEKLGIVIAITAETDKEKSRLKNDFVRHLRTLVNNSQLGHLVEVVPLTNHQAQRVGTHLTAYKSQLMRLTSENIPIEPSLAKARTNLQKRIRGTFYVWGNVFQREEGKYFLEVDSIVHHGTGIEVEQKKQLASDMTSIWSSKFSFQDKAEYAGFLFSAEHVYLAAEYIIGEAAFAARSFEVALTLHESLKKKLTTLAWHPNFETIEQRLTQLLSEEHSITSVLCHRDKNDVVKAMEHAKKSLHYDPNNHDAKLLLGLFEFIHEGNPEKALRTTYESAATSNGVGTWRYNAAFLELKLGRTKKALALYRDIEKHEWKDEEEILAQVYEFNSAILEEQPDNIESRFILGLLKYKKSNNAPEALEHLQRVIELAGNKRNYDLLVAEARTCVGKIESIMRLK